MSPMKKLKVLLFLLIISISSGCKSPSSPENPQSNATPTSTLSAVIQATSTEQKNNCDELSGTVSVEILVGPSEVVGLEPVAVGNIPFSVISDGGLYTLTGGGPINFDEQVFEAEWGTYTVNFAADTILSGICDPSLEGESLSMTLEMTGEQVVEVNASGFQAEYPWEGTQVIDVYFPVVDGAQQEGEGWLLVLHLSP
jgi:hypothetical protein